MKHVVLQHNCNATDRRRLAFKLLQQYPLCVRTPPTAVLWRWFVPCVVVALTAVIGCFVSPRATDGAPSVLLVDDSNPLAGRTFYVDPTSSAMVAAANAVPPSSELTAIASTPQAHWIGNEIGVADVAAYVQNYVGAAASASSLPILTLYAIPHRDCGGFTAGGFATAEEYRAWIAGVKEGRDSGGDHPRARCADGRGLSTCRSAGGTLGVATGRRRDVEPESEAAVYIDGGHSRWLSPEELARRSRRRCRPRTGIQPEHIELLHHRPRRSPTARRCRLDRTAPTT